MVGEAILKTRIIAASLTNVFIHTEEKSIILKDTTCISEDF